MKRKYDMEKIHELLNSRVTLNKRETELVDRYIFDVSAYYYPKDYQGVRFK